ncbi:MAG: 3-oxoacid CoA-transferase subunit A [Proteobacteria bacterium]|nr:3-oxoacid CoA-transferase subunit A [Pseudomonadota bacterium]
MNKVIPLSKAMDMVHDKATLMVNGFMAVKSPETLIDSLVRKGIRDLTIIANDAAVPGKGIGKLLSAGQIKKMIASHIGLNPEAGVRMNTGTLEVDLVPQGTLVERIRCGGAGLGGVLTPTGIGTSVEDGKRKIVVNDQDYILELPLRAEIALLKGSVVDTIGNVYYRGTTKNFSLVMAMACDLVIVEAETLVEVGDLDPDLVMTPSLFVDYIVREGDAS